MTKPEPPLNFSSEQERREWITANADYFTVIQRAEGKYIRHEFPTLKEAETAATNYLVDQPEARFMIYAIYNSHDTWVKTIEAKLTHGKNRASPEGQ